MASHTSLEHPDNCVCGYCKPRRRMSRRRRRRSRPRRRRSSKCVYVKPCKPRRRRSRRRRSRSRSRKVCMTCGSNPCKRSCKCGCTTCRCLQCTASPADCNTSSNAFMNFLCAYKRRRGKNKNIVTVASEAGRMWQEMSDEEKENYNYNSPSDNVQLSFGNCCPDCKVEEFERDDLAYRPVNGDENDDSLQEEPNNEQNIIQSA